MMIILQVPQVLGVGGFYFPLLVQVCIVSALASKLIDKEFQ
jgi:hypothetical protein